MADMSASNVIRSGFATADDLSACHMSMLNGAFERALPARFVLT